MGTAAPVRGAREPKGVGDAPRDPSRHPERGSNGVFVRAVARQLELEARAGVCGVVERWQPTNSIDGPNRLLETRRGGAEIAQGDLDRREDC
jgi:hypothetical protein